MPYKQLFGSDLSLPIVNRGVFVTAFTKVENFCPTLSFLDGFCRKTVLAGRAFLNIEGLNLNISLCHITIRRFQVTRMGRCHVSFPRFHR